MSIYFKYKLFGGLITVAATVLGLTASGQSTPPQLETVIRPTPSAQAMQKYGDIPVSAYTGVPNISIPLYTISFRDITLPISLSYHASGIKVGEEASQVGLGWVLNAGGSISRNIIGQDDFSGSIYFHSSLNNAPDFSDTLGLINSSYYGCIEELYDNSRTAAQTILYDTLTTYLNAVPAFEFQPDQYYFNIPGENGKFIMNRNAQAILLKQEKVQISLTSSDGTSWEITSLDGTRYDFTQYETYVDPMVNGDVNHMSAWYLTKITSPTGNIITFKYAAQTLNVQPQGSYSENRDDFDFPDTYYSSTGGSGTFFPIGLPSQKGETPGKVYSTLVLDTIDFNNGLVTFNYSFNRPDLPGDQRLDSICVFSRNPKGYIEPTPFRTIALTYDYFNYGDVDDDFNADPGASTAYWERMKLTGMQQIGYFGGTRVANPPYTFAYYESGLNVLPSKASFARDHWGYYNGKTGHTSLIPSVLSVSSSDLVTAELGIPGPERDPDSNYMRAFSLDTIYYPTGGYTSFQYEANDFDEAHSEVNDFSFFSQVPSVVPAHQEMIYDAVLQQVDGTDTLDLTSLYNYSYNPLVSGSTANVTVNAAFRMSDSASCSMGLEPNNIMYFELYDTAGNLLLHTDPANATMCSGGSTTNCVFCSGPVYSYSFSMTLNPARYVWKAYVASSNYGLQVQDIHVTYTWNAIQSAVQTYGSNGGSYYTIGGGLRIHRIADHDPLNPGADRTRRYVYHYMSDTATEFNYANSTPIELSYGRRMAKPEYAYFTASLEEDNINFSATLSYLALHLMRSSDSNIPLNGSALGAVVGYDQVTELQGDNGENGQTVYQYHNQPDIVSSYNDQIPDAVASGFFPDRPPYASNIPDPQNGNLLRQTDYANISGAFYPLRRTTYTYNLVDSVENKVWAIESRFPTIHVLFNGETNSTSQGADCQRYLYGYRTLQSDWIYMASKDEKLYNTNDTTQYAETLNEYFYDDTAHLLPTRTVTIDSKGDTVTTTTHYPLDYTSATASDPVTAGIRYLQNAHVINTPIEKYVKKVTSNGSNIGVVNGSFRSYNSNNPLPNILYEAKLAGPSTSFMPAAANSGAVTMDASYEQRVAFEKYDAYGNLVQQQKVSDVMHSYLWDYRSSLPICEAVNADSADIAYTSFEADGSGNWTLGSGTVDTTTGITGRSSFLPAGNITKTGLNSATTYIVSYWSQGGSFSVSGTMSGYPLTGKTVSINGTSWTLYVHKVTGQTTVTVSGSGHLDELRLYPSTAQMITYTYAPLVGMTSQTDVGNRVTYYQYDGLSRLSRVRDQDYNILKTYQYQYQAPAGCGGNCYSVAMQTFLGTNTLSYPVGVFGIHGNLVGQAANAAQYDSLWNSDTADSRIGTLAQGQDSMHFNLALNTGQTLIPGVTGCRYFQVDLKWNYIDGIRNSNGTYVAFGDGTGMHLSTQLNAVPPTLPPSTTYYYENTNPPTGDNLVPGVYFQHTYSDTSLKTLTLYHNDASEDEDFDNAFSTTSGLYTLQNLRGNLPAHMQTLGGSCYEQSSMTSVANVSNWTSINSIHYFRLNNGDAAHPCEHIGYPQDFLANDPGLISILTTWTIRRTGVRDSTFKLTRLKSNWNTYFTQLQQMEISEADWNHESLSNLTQLNQFTLYPVTQDGMDTPGSPLVALSQSEIDNIIIQIAAGAGQTVNNGQILIVTGGTTLSSNSTAAYNLLISKGWAITIDSTDH